MNSFLTTLVNNCLLLRCQTVINLLVDAEEQTIIDCIPHRAVWLNLLHTCRIDCRQRVLLSFYCILLQSRVGLCPVQVCCICAPSLIAFHKKIGTCHTDLKILHIIQSLDLAFAVGDLTETILCDTHAVQTIFGKQFFQFFTGCSVKFCICVIIRIINKWKRYYIESRIKCGIDQVGMHGNLYRISIHQCLDSFRLISVCQLVSCININFNLASGCLFHQFAELTSTICPGTCLRCGACKIPGHFWPVKVAVIFNCIKGIVVISGILGSSTSCIR